MAQVTRFTLPMRPSRMSPTAACRNFCPISLRCCVPTWKTRLVSLSTLMNLLPLFNGEGERFFAVDVFAGFHRFDGDLRMPVIRRDDGDHTHMLFVLKDLLGSPHTMAIFGRASLYLP